MKTVNIRIGSITIECEEKLAVSAGYGHPYANDETRTARGGDHRAYGTGMHLTPNQALAIALSEGATGEMAVFRAIAIRTASCGTGETAAALEIAKVRKETAEIELSILREKNTEEIA